MRIAMVGLRGVPATYGGVETAVESLGAELVELGHDVTVFCRSRYYAERLRDYRGMRLRYLPAPTVKGVEAFVHSGLAAGVALGGRFDLVHFHALGPGLFSPVSRFGSRAAVVQTVHGLDNERAKWGGGAKRLLDAGAWLSARVPDEVIAVSADLGRHYQDRWQRRTTVIRNAAPTPADGHLPPPVDGRYVLFAGRLVPEKRVDDLIRAWRSVPHADVRLVVAGGPAQDGAYAAAVADLAKADDRVRLLGHVDRHVLDSLYTHATAFALPSALEGMPLALLEAAATGIPVVASSIAPHREILDGGAGQRMFPVGDVPALGRLLTSVLDDIDGERQGALGLQQSVLRRSWRDVALATLVVYESALYGQPRAAERRATPRRAVAFA